jgi:segregation and condensation protein B
MPDLPAAPPDADRLRAIIEALVFAAEEPVTLAELVELFPGTGEEVLAEAIETLTRSCQAPDRGLQIIQVAGGHKMTTRAELGGWVRALFRSRNRRRLSAAALETLAIVAYRQPVTTPEIHSLRGTDPSAVLQNLLDKKLVRVVGRKKVVGKPFLYGTSRDFLNHFGLNSLADLPSIEEFGEMAAALDRSPANAPPPAEAGGPFEEPQQDDDSEGTWESPDDEDDDHERGDDGDDS